MPYRLTVDQPNLPEGKDVYIVGLGTFPNGGTYEITDAQALAFEHAHTRDDGSYDFDNDANFGTGLYVPKHVKGPPLVEAATAMHGISVEEIKPVKETKAPVVLAESEAPSDLGGEG